MEFYCLGSGSSGNAYIFVSGKNENKILIECGFEYRKLCAKILDAGFQVSDINAVVCTHNHKDHCESIDSWLDRNTPVIAPEDCYKREEDKKQLSIKAGMKVDLTENIRILAFDVAHDCSALGYIIYDKKTKEKALFINDTYYFEFIFKKYDFDYIFIECNHLRQKLNAIRQKALELGKPVAKYDRQERYHMSLAALKKFLNGMNLKKTKAIYLMHMSEECCDREICEDVIKAKYGIETYSCLSNGGFSKAK